jgi:hypothetical protein
MLVNHTKKKKTIINESNLKRKMIRKTWEKKYFFKMGLAMYLNSQPIKYERTK